MKIILLLLLFIFILLYEDSMFFSIPFWAGAQSHTFWSPRTSLQRMIREVIKTNKQKPNQKGSKHTNRVLLLFAIKQKRD